MYTPILCLIFSKFCQVEKCVVSLVDKEAMRTKLNAIYDSLNVVHRLHEGELAKALGVQLGFNANDGD